MPLYALLASQREVDSIFSICVYRGPSRKPQRTRTALRQILEKETASNGHRLRVLHSQDNSVRC